MKAHDRQTNARLRDPSLHELRRLVRQLRRLVRQVNTIRHPGGHAQLVRSRKWSSLRAWGIKIAKQRGMARARVAVARKLAVVLHRMWSDKTEFRFGKEPGTPATA
jgi:hypothetical protein